MAYFYLIPQWFFGFDIALEVIFALIALAVAFFSFKIYKMTEEDEIKLFGLSFVFIAASYVLWAVINLFLLSEASEVLAAPNLSRIAILSLAGIYAHMCFFIIGLVTLVYTTFKVKNGSIYYVLLGTSIMVIAASLHKIATFWILSLFLLSFVSYHYFEEYMKKKNKKAGFVTIAFTLLLLSSVVFAFTTSFYSAYIIGYLLELAAYTLILISLISTIKR